jgi:DNA-binding transcriptional LysR family regulator
MKTEIAGPLRSRLKMRHLATIVTVSRARSVIGAAKILHTSQPAVSRSLAEIEKLAGGALFERRARETVPTPLGAALVRHAEEVFGSLERAELELDHIRRGGIARLVVGCNLSASMSLVPQAILRLQKSHPGIYVALRESSLENLLVDLRARRVDVVVARSEQATRSDDLHALALPDEPLAIVAAPDHPLARKRQVAWKDLEKVPWIKPPASTPVGEGLELIFEREGITPAATGVEAMGSLATLHFLQELRAVTVFPLKLAERLAQGGLVACLALPLPPVFRPLAAITLRAAQNSPALDSFIACLMQASGK